MSNHQRRLRAGWLILLVVLLATAMPIPAHAVTDRLPDLKMSYPRFFSVDTTTIAGHRLLRFTTIIPNAGVGPFEVHGRRSSTSASTMSVAQVVYDDAGGRHEVATSDTMVYDVGDGHNHWHLKWLASYKLLNSGGSVVATSPKIGFCFYDGELWYSGLPGTPASRVYPSSGCGTTTSLEVRTGLSVGWADRYPYSVGHQWIDITNISDGTYRVRVTADARNYFLETNNVNNSNYADVKIQGTTVTVLGQGPR